MSLVSLKNELVQVNMLEGEYFELVLLDDNAKGIRHRVSWNEQHEPQLESFYKHARTNPGRTGAGASAEGEADDRDADDDRAAATVTARGTVAGLKLW